ncbi:XRE family transcriptional regulator [Micromonospora globbae]|uniref:XRE family transcriptional regulator n=1 Tax=Micromonospora globbae TaxID=1894969 RepID=A0ABZ1S4H9_9ACTN|nr:XRE family transcriptional regulator [Micromonospora globbae]
MLAAAPGERLKTLRDILGLTQSQLAEVSGVSQPWISEVETSSKEATPDKLQQIAHATGTPVSFFSARPASVPLDTLRFRKSSAARKTTTRRVHAIYGESYRVTEDLVGAEGYPTPSLPFASGEANLTDADIEQLASETREALQLAPDKPIPHLTRALERAGIAVAPMVLPDIEGDEQAAVGHFGVSYWGGLGATALIGYFPGRQGDRDRFTLGHELGHLVLHTFRPRTSHSQAEEEANLFATALLVPLERAQASMSDKLSLTDYARLKATWGVSIQALIMRGHTVGAIGDTRKNSLFVQLSAKGWRKREPVAVGHESPKLLWTLLSRRYGSRPYVQGADELAIHPTVLRSIAPTPQSSQTRGSQVSSTRSSTVKVVDFDPVRKSMRRRA